MRILDDEDMVTALQDGHGGWNHLMKKVCILVHTYFIPNPKLITFNTDTICFSLGL